MTVTYLDPDKRAFFSGITARANTEPLWSVRVAMHTHVSTSHTLTVPSPPPLITRPLINSNAYTLLRGREVRVMMARIKVLMVACENGDEGERRDHRRKDNQWYIGIGE